MISETFAQIKQKENKMLHFWGVELLNFSLALKKMFAQDIVTIYLFQSYLYLLPYWYSLKDKY